MISASVPQQASVRLIVLTDKPSSYQGQGIFATTEWHPSVVRTYVVPQFLYCTGTQPLKASLEGGRRQADHGDGKVRKRRKCRVSFHGKLGNGSTIQMLRSAPGN